MNSSFYLFICVLKNFVFLSILSVDVRQKRTRCDTLWTTDKHPDRDTQLSCLFSVSSLSRWDTEKHFTAHASSSAATRRPVLV